MFMGKLLAYAAMKEGMLLGFPLMVLLCEVGLPTAQ